MEPLPARAQNPSPFRPLLIWLGPFLAIANLSLVPCFATILSISLSRAFFKGPTPPPAPFWLPMLQWLSLTLALLIPVQAFLVTLCFTWSPGSYWRRFGQHWLTVLASVSLLLGGLLLMVVPEWFKQTDSLGSFRQNAMEIAAALASLPILLLGTQTPFWLARFFCGCRLERASASKQQEPSLPNDSLRLRDLFVATALIAVSLGLLQIPAALAQEQGNTEHAFLFMMLLAAGICCGIALVIGLPLAMLFLTLRDLRLAWGITLAAAGIFAIGQFGVIHCYFTPAPKPAEALASACMWTYVFSIGSGLGLTILRRSGWRMVTRWSDSSS